MDVSEILGRYSAREPHRARGGLSTVAGISFQLQCYLADFVSDLAHGTDIRRAGEHLLEAFSDYTKPDAQQLVCVQVKRTLDKTALGHAAAEAVVVDEFFEAEAVDFHDQISFEAVGLIGTKSGTAPSWEGVQLPKDLKDRSRRQDRFERMQRAGRLRTPRIEPDPWWGMISASWFALDDPFAFAREALEICLKRGMVPGEAVVVRDKVAEAFAKHRRLPHFPGWVITEADLALNQQTSREVLLGQIPTLQHLRDGRFMERPDQLVAALKELDRHILERDWRQEPYIYAFWIEGTSGNGKSVLLLQLMRQLVADRFEQVIWLDDASEQLLPLLEAWAENPRDGLGACYVFVDDFYAPSKRSGVEFQKIARLTRQHERADWPILVTCGPPEQRQEWKASGDAEAFRTSGWTLPLSKKAEQEQLRRWFWKRTGEEPKTSSAFREGESLMISMMFEMREGKMLEFGRRFRQRLEDLGLVDALVLQLALNRLYILAPGYWLDEAQSDALRRLNREKDFSMFTLGSRTGQFIRVSHPHLSNAIYTAVRERDDAIVRARDLHRAFSRSLETDSGTAKLILHRVAEGHERLCDVDGEELARGMAGTWVEHRWSVDNLPRLDLASVWTNWTIWNARQALIADVLGEQPLRVARECLGKNHPYWAAIWIQLWNCFPGDNGLLSDAETWLSSAEERTSLPWSGVWEIVFEYRKSNRQNLAQLAEWGADWLRNNEFLPDWNFVLRSIASALPERCPWQSCFHLLDELPGNRNWAYVFETIADNRARFDRPRVESVFRAGSAWLQLAESQETSEWSFVWQKLVEVRAELPKESGKDLLTLGYSWLAGREDRDGWAFVWQKLVEVRAELPKESGKELLPLGYSWLAGREDRDRWSFVWQELVELRAELPKESAKDLLQIGYTWLAGRDDRDRWSFVWQELVELRAELAKER